MPVKQLIKYYKDGQEIVWNTTPSLNDLLGFGNATPTSTAVSTVSIVNWVKTLTADEQAEFAAAQERQQANQQAKIDSGMIISTTDTDGITWNANSESAVTEIKFEQDPVWFAYWERWQSETGITHTETYTTV
jgi:hypothetical protein